MKYIIGICSVTNGGKTTLTNQLIKNLPNCCVVHQDDFFNPSLLFVYLTFYSFTCFHSEKETRKKRQSRLTC
uniref:Muscle-specific beta 1 integrin binding protein 2 n=1 Tax=Amphiprion ocellaris TaxID=80972 RepID=A0A3Q1BJI7_AMPOC